jgi:hypothetical protein
MLIVGALAFIGSMIGLFIARRRNPRAWRQAVGPIIAGLVLMIFAVAAIVIVAIARRVRSAPLVSSTARSQQVNAAASSQVWERQAERNDAG